MDPEKNCAISIESSIQNLIKNWTRRQKWKLFFNSEQQQHKVHNNRAPWRITLSKFLESTLIRATAIVLVVIDLILTVLELSSSLLSCTSKNNYNYKTEQVWLHWAGIGILSLLCLKAIAEAIGLGFDFFQRPGYVVDGTVVIGALFLEAFLEKKGGGLLVVVSLWRVVRVIESAFELSDEAIEAQIEDIVCQFELLRQENVRLLEQVGEKDVIICNLEQIIQDLQSSSCN